MRAPNRASSRAKSKPPAWVPHPKHDHQGRRDKEAAAYPPAAAPNLLARLGHHGLVPSRRKEAEDDADRDNPDQPQQGGEPVKLVGIIDVQAGGVLLRGCGHGLPPHDVVKSTQSVGKDFEPGGCRAGCVRQCRNRTPTSHLIAIRPPRTTIAARSRAASSGQRDGSAEEIGYERTAGVRGWLWHGGLQGLPPSAAVAAGGHGCVASWRVLAIASSASDAIAGNEQDNDDRYVEYGGIRVRPGLELHTR